MRGVVSFLLILSVFVCAFPVNAQKRKPLKKIQQDTIVIPEDIIFEVMEDEILAEQEAEAALLAKNSARISILGEPEVEVEQMYNFIRSQNPDFQRDIAEAFYYIGKIYGVRGDIALCQSALETGWFKFTGGTAVTPDQHNYCGLGVTRLGIKGHSFDTIEDGVTAQIQHLYAYACKKPLPNGEKMIDPRFSLVVRGIAPTWNDLNRKWAMNDHYSERIMSIFARMKDFEDTNQ